MQTLKEQLNTEGLKFGAIAMLGKVAEQLEKLLEGGDLSVNTIEVADEPQGFPRVALNVTTYDHTNWNGDEGELGEFKVVGQFQKGIHIEHDHWDAEPIPFTYEAMRFLTP